MEPEQKRVYPPVDYDERGRKIRDDAIGRNILLRIEGQIGDVADALASGDNPTRVLDLAKKIQADIAQLHPYILAFDRQRGHSLADYIEGNGVQ
jgi:hypothetical protein